MRSILARRKSGGQFHSSRFSNKLAGAEAAKILEIPQLIYEAVRLDDRSLITIFFFIVNRRHWTTRAAEEERLLQKLLEEISPLLAGAELKWARAGAEVRTTFWHRKDSRATRKAKHLIRLETKEHEEKINFFFPWVFFLQFSFVGCWCKFD